MNNTNNIDAIDKLAALWEQENTRPDNDIERLAGLSEPEYERVRTQEAKKIGVRVGELDKYVSTRRREVQQTKEAGILFPVTSAWPSPVDGATLLDDILDTIKTFIVCDDATAQAATLWTVFTWFIERVQVAPIAVITAPEKRCGKSQLLEIIGKMCYRPLIAANISSASIFRTIEAYQPTMLIDEVDSFLKGNDEMRGIINSGHTRVSAYVLRVVGESHEPKRFSTWGAKVICGIGTMPDTIVDRAIPLTLRRKLPTERVERLRRTDPQKFERIRRKLARFVEDAGDIIAASCPSLPDELNDRAQDNWEPLIAIADCAGGHWPQTARDAALQLAEAEKHVISDSTLLLGDIRDIFQDKGVDRITTDDMLKELNGNILKPWFAYNRGNPMTAYQLARMLAEYKIRPQNLNMGGAARPKGYMRADFDDAFSRYLATSTNTP